MLLDVSIRDLFTFSLASATQLCTLSVFFPSSFENETKVNWFKSLSLFYKQKHKTDNSVIVKLRNNKPGNTI